MPTNKLVRSSCDIVLSSLAQQLDSDPVQFATSYEYRLTPVGGGTSLIYTYPVYRLQLSWVTGIQSSTTYDVDIRVNKDGIWSDYGASCQVTTPSGAMLAEETARLAYYGDEEVVIENPTTLSIYPNPNSGDQLNVNLEYLTPNSTLTVTDLYGKVILTKQLNTDQSEYRVNVQFENKLSAGFYLVSISSEGNTITEKLIVR